jgi:hypothetical protein
MSKMFHALDIAEDTNHPKENREYVFRQYFHDDVLAILPAGKMSALYDYAEHYEGIQQQAVRGLAACILTGTSFSREASSDDADGGMRVLNDMTPVKPAPGGIAQELHT